MQDVTAVYDRARTLLANRDVDPCTFVAHFDVRVCQLTGRAGSLVSLLRNHYPGMSHGDAEGVIHEVRQRLVHELVARVSDYGMRFLCEAVDVGLAPAEIVQVAGTLDLPPAHGRVASVLRRLYADAQDMDDVVMEFRSFLQSELVRVYATEHERRRMVVYDCVLEA